jgi:hypothetical protein
MTVQELYEAALHTLSPSERLVLANLLLSNVVGQDIEYRDDWSEEDMREFSAASMRTIDERLWMEGDAGLG